MLNPIWLETFATLVETGHFTKTAEKRHMTQPGVSQHINKLEEACGHVLIKRDNKSFVITEQGQIVYNHAKALLKTEKHLFEQLNFDDPYSGDCSLACSGSVALLLYPKLLKLQRHHQDLHIHVKAAPNHQILEEIKLSQIDQGIVTNLPNENAFSVEEIGQEELCLVCSRHLSLKKNPQQALSEVGLISHPDAKHYLSLYFNQSSKLELQKVDINKIPVIGSINQIGQILEPLAQGIGFTILPKSVLNSFHSPELLKTLQTQKPVMERLYLVRKKHRALPKRYEIVSSIIRQVWE